MSIAQAQNYFRDEANIANALQGYGNITRIPSVSEMYDPSYALAALR